MSDEFSSEEKQASWNKGFQGKPFATGPGYESDYTSHRQGEIWRENLKGPNSTGGIYGGSVATTGGGGGLGGILVLIPPLLPLIFFEQTVWKILSHKGVPLAGEILACLAMTSAAFFAVFKILVSLPRVTAIVLLTAYIELSYWVVEYNYTNWSIEWFIYVIAFIGWFFAYAAWVLLSARTGELGKNWSCVFWAPALIAFGIYFGSDRVGPLLMPDGDMRRQELLDTYSKLPAGTVLEIKETCSSAELRSVDDNGAYFSRIRNIPAGTQVLFERVDTDSRIFPAWWYYAKDYGIIVSVDNDECILPVSELRITSRFVDPNPSNRFKVGDIVTVTNPSAKCSKVVNETTTDPKEMFKNFPLTLGTKIRVEVIGYGNLGGYVGKLGYVIFYPADVEKR